MPHGLSSCYIALRTLAYQLTLRCCTESPTVREHTVESADSQQSYSRWPPGETALTGPGTVSVTLPLFHELPYRNLRLTPAFDILDASAGRVSQLIEVPYYAADRWHTRSLSVRRCRLPGTMFQEEHLRARLGRT